MEVKESHQTVAVGDASLYLSADDDAAIEAHTGKTIAHVDFDGIPEEVKTKLSPLLQSKPGSTVTAEGKMGHTERSGENLCKNVPGDKYQPLFEGGVDYFRL